MHLIDKQVASSRSNANFFHTCNLMDRGRETILVGLSGRRSFPLACLSLARVFRAPYISHAPATQATKWLKNQRNEEANSQLSQLDEEDLQKIVCFCGNNACSSSMAGGEVKVHCDSGQRKLNISSSAFIITPTHSV